MEINEHKTTLGDARRALRYLEQTEDLANVETDPEEHARDVAYSTIESYLDNIQSGKAGLMSIELHKDNILFERREAQRRLEKKFNLLWKIAIVVNVVLITLLLMWLFWWN